MEQKDSEVENCFGVFLLLVLSFCVVLIVNSGENEKFLSIAFDKN